MSFWGIFLSMKNIFEFTESLKAQTHKVKQMYMKEK